MTKIYYLKREDAPQHGGRPVITAATHLPRVLSIDDARILAAELISLTNPEISATDLEIALKAPAYRPPPAPRSAE